ncbi:MULTISPECIES: hypothetical protein [Aeromonas]|uniref:hypothetical protein n=1 Tax=Aeromonas TaxID=642 RepID=UPI000B9C31C7|nr:MULTISPECIES: hypothetical protein [Aeromonas]AUZ77111.1 hypothetical protein C2U40_21285 [Aeromonas sp. ASNIH4]KAE9637377.1 hypothetical protein GO977_00020 [Aeromonas veronii]OZG42512.1 hypothetical protein CAK78_07510 [Aeromonas sp. A35_P]POU39349.1 hypothetical protein C3405_09640 [Aeromonas hydrophila]POV88909.1 hypothetical protein C3395_09645 [Aeromonas sp. ASNIH6]
MMEHLNLLFAALDVVAGLVVMGRAVRYRNWGVTGLMLAYVLLKAPYTVGQTEFKPEFFFWLAYDLAMLVAIWFEMGKRREA